MNASSSLDLPAPEGPAHVHPVRVTYRMTDQMGVVYYGHYLEIFEIGRVELLRAAGLTYSRMERDGYRLPVVRAEVDYLTPARYDDLLEIHTRVARLTRVRFDFHYEVRRAGEAEPVCRGLTHHVVTGADGAPRRLDRGWMDELQANLFVETTSPRAD